MQAHDSRASPQPLTVAFARFGQCVSPLTAGTIPFGSRLRPFGVGCPCEGLEDSLRFEGTREQFQNQKDMLITRECASEARAHTVLQPSKTHAPSRVVDAVAPKSTSEGNQGQTCATRGHGPLGSITTKLGDERSQLQPRNHNLGKGRAGQSQERRMQIVQNQVAHPRNPCPKAALTARGKKLADVRLTQQTRTPSSHPVTHPSKVCRWYREDIRTLTRSRCLTNKHFGHEPPAISGYEPGNRRRCGIFVPAPCRTLPFGPLTTEYVVNRRHLAANHQRLALSCRPKELWSRGGRK